MSNDELQKAIDDITKGDSAANNVEATSVADSGVASVPLPDDLASDSASANANMNFMETPDTATGESADLFGVPPVPDISNAMPGGDVSTNPAVVAAPEEILPETGGDAGSSVGTPDFNLGDAGVATSIDDPVVEAQPADVPPAPNVNVTEVSGDLEAVKTAALIELYPLLPTMNVNPRQKFDICMTVIEKTGDKGAASIALDAAKQIVDATEKGDCLMKLVEQINQL